MGYKIATRKNGPKKCRIVNNSAMHCRSFV